MADTQVELASKVVNEVTNAGGRAELHELDVAQAGAAAAAVNDIVNTASICGLVALPLAATYNSAKHGVVGLTKSAALEYGPKGVRVDAICPGFIDTLMLAKGAGSSEKVPNSVLGQLPQRRIAGPEEVADAAAWLLSEQSSYVTGIAMPIDGGWTAQ